MDSDLYTKEELREFLAIVWWFLTLPSWQAVTSLLLFSPNTLLKIFRLKNMNTGVHTKCSLLATLWIKSLQNLNLCTSSQALKSCKNKVFQRSPAVQTTLTVTHHVIFFNYPKNLNQHWMLSKVKWMHINHRIFTSHGIFHPRQVHNLWVCFPSQRNLRKWDSK